MLESLFNKVDNTRVLVNIAKLLNRAFYKKKSHTCEEGGAHLRIFFLVFIDEFEKQLFVKKSVEVG